MIAQNVVKQKAVLSQVAAITIIHQEVEEVVNPLRAAQAPQTIILRAIIILPAPVIILLFPVVRLVQINTVGIVLVKSVAQIILTVENPKMDLVVIPVNQVISIFTHAKMVNFLVPLTIRNTLIIMPNVR